VVKCENCGKQISRRKAYVQGQRVKMVCKECYKELSFQAYKGLCDAIMREKDGMTADTHYQDCILAKKGG